MSANRLPLAGVLGWPIAHSRSPRLHRHWLARYGIEGDYITLGVEPRDFEAAFREGGGGLLEFFVGDVGEIRSRQVADLDVFPAELLVGPDLAAKILGAFIGDSRIEHLCYYGGAVSPALVVSVNLRRRPV